MQEHAESRTNRHVSYHRQAAIVSEVPRQDQEENFAEVVPSLHAEERVDGEVVRGDQDESREGACGLLAYVQMQPMCHAVQ